MKLRTGIIYSSTETPTGEGLTQPVRGIVKVDGQLQAAVIKRIPKDAVIAECFCALLMRGWELPVPEPILVVEGETLVFASLDSGYPNLKQQIGWHDGWPAHIKQRLERFGASIVCGWPDAPRLLAVDELIANADRNLGNFLWDGSTHAYIDHERTLGLYPHVHNLLVVMALVVGKAEPIEAGAVAAALALDRSIPAAIESPEELDFSKFVAYIESRLPALASQVLARFPQPKDLFAGLNA
jgi:hypothetical protein